jgi:hypothetical protein
MFNDFRDGCQYRMLYGMCEILCDGVDLQDCSNEPKCGGCPCQCTADHCPKKGEWEAKP